MDSRLVDKYISFVDKISQKYQYDNNITHLLYLIVPAFVSKYSIYKEKQILDIFFNVKILISEDVNQSVQAYYTSIPHYEGEDIVTSKYIVIQNYQDISLVQLMDNLVHEFNHAVNSYQKEIVIDKSTLYLRTGLSYATYSLSDLSPLKKQDSYILEEILNTHQTEEIINIIKSYQDPQHMEFNNMITAFNHETDSRYTSRAYYLENAIFQPILDNKTFLSTLNNLRISGDVMDIEDWFDHIVGHNGSYAKMIEYLKEIMNLEEKYASQFFFKNRTVEKIRDYIRKILKIIETFNQNCNYR